MGAWGVGSFSNDSALDWCEDVLDGKDVVEAVRAVLTEVAELSDDDYLDADEGAPAVAAADVLACALGKPPEDITDDYQERFEPHFADLKADVALRSTALKALARIAAENSELAELWAEGGDGEWTDMISDLRDRLGGTG